MHESERATPGPQLHPLVRQERGGPLLRHGRRRQLAAPLRQVPGRASQVLQRPDLHALDHQHDGIHGRPRHSPDEEGGGYVQADHHRAN